MIETPTTNRDASMATAMWSTKTGGRRLAWMLTVAGTIVVASDCGGDPQVNLGSTVAQLSDFAASWDGYVEASSFPVNGSDRIRIELDATGQGTLEVGDAPPLPPATQAEGGYLLDEIGFQLPEFRDGFKYRVHLAEVHEGRIRFGVLPAEILASWCALVAPVPDPTSPTGYSCANTSLGLALNRPNDCYTIDQQKVKTQYDCGIASLCFFDACSCTASACGAWTLDGATSASSYPVLVDAALDPGGTSMSGTLVVAGDPVSRVTIRLHRRQ